MFRRLHNSVIYAACVTLSACLISVTIGGPAMADGGSGLPTYDTESEAEMFRVLIREEVFPYEVVEGPTRFGENALVIPIPLLMEHVREGRGDGSYQGELGSGDWGGTLRAVLAGLLLSAAAVSMVLLIRRRGDAKPVRALLLVGTGLLVGAGLFAAFEYSGSREALADTLSFGNDSRRVEGNQELIRVYATERGDTIRFYHAPMHAQE